ncbi:uncharacterized protein LOC110242208 [Exaiptasia diaphana]|uniref:Uncharacterized protein n=1 Tax=Exaiptasia diaphana TaxID=2652724 RepID=A0A913XG14_EXADI|nr:uncharacterized protein LOC110242208 [Exaiptasia diaphana]KXJ12414.1 hypothetical protein AC249_AIPGENE895 [Exaiptasia diaphana]
MADHRGKIPVGKGIPSESELLKPLIFPNSQRAFKIFNSVLAAGITVYFVFFHKFPQEDHCFMPIRNFVEEQKANFFRVRPEDEDYIKQKAAELRREEELKKTA